MYSLFTRNVHTFQINVQKPGLSGLQLFSCLQESLKQKDQAESSFIIEKIVGKLLRTENMKPFLLYLTPCKTFYGIYFKLIFYQILPLESFTVPSDMHTDSTSYKN